MALTADYLREVLDYNPETGEFRWKRHMSNRRGAGQEAGCICSRSGYRLIGIKGVVHKANRLAWLYVHGEWPDRFVDHINGKTGDDRIANLRLATHQENLCNRGRQKNNRSGYKGVCLHKPSQKWHARINSKGRQHYLGIFNTPEEAHQAYSLAAQQLHGDFAKTK
jgi:hypothetical protein